ncbi:class I SAM-dependent methyltransferase [Enterococcus sp. LJL120]
MTVKDYYQEIQQPWGELFYKLLFQQLEQSLPAGGRILDFGSGFGKTASFLSQTHQVVAYEPNAEMLPLRLAADQYRQLTGSFAEFEAAISQQAKFDGILLHNVLEYVALEERPKVLALLQSRLNPGGKMSIVKHNRNGTIFAKAVLQDDPALALSIINGGASRSANFGTVAVYETEWLAEVLQPLKVAEHFGLRTFFGLSQNTEVKYTKAWQEAMFDLEEKASQQAEFIAVAMFNHLIFS